MFTVIYVFDVKPDREQEFLDAWAFITKEFVRTRNSLGSRMHKDKDGRHIAIALWPDRASWEAKPNEPSEELTAARTTMMRACELVRTDKELDTVLDLWVTGPPA